MGEAVKELCRNRITYEKELKAFKRETLDKIEVFRAERSKWLAENRGLEVNGSAQHGLNDSDLYKGRCLILRKLGFRTNRLVSHYKVLRPLKCYTLKMKSCSKETDTKSQMSVAMAADVAPGNVANVFAQRSARMNLWKGAQTRVLHSQIENDRERNPVLKTDIEKEEQEPLGADSDKKKSLWKWRRNKDKPKEKKKKGPSRRAMENLKAAAQANRLIESCRCQDGKEVTVVIKGFCPCDKLNLNQLKLDKLRKDYQKSQVLETAPTQPTPAVLKTAPASQLEIGSHVKNSLEIHRKRMGGKGGAGEKPLDSSLAKKGVRFRGKELLSKKIASMVTLFRNGEREGSTMALTRDQHEKMKKSSSAKGGR